MKKLKLLIMAFVATAALSGCTEKYYGAQIQTIEFEVVPNDWIANQGTLPSADNYFYCDVKMPEITPEVFEHGTVQVYVYTCYDVDNNLWAWNPLPFVAPMEDLDENLNNVFVPKNIRYTLEVGYLTLIAQPLDGYDPLIKPSTLTFKVCITTNM